MPNNTLGCGTKLTRGRACRFGLRRKGGADLPVRAAAWLCDRYFPWRLSRGVGRVCYAASCAVLRDLALRTCGCWPPRSVITQGGACKGAASCPGATSEGLRCVWVR